MPGIPEDILPKLIKICGMFGSDGIGERGNAALHADKIIRSLGFTWASLLASVGTTTPTVDKQVLPKHIKLYQIADTLLNDRAINTWQYDFLTNLLKFKTLSTRQQAKVDEIWTIAERGAYV